MTEQDDGLLFDAKQDFGPEMFQVVAPNSSFAAAAAGAGAPGAGSHGPGAGEDGDDTVTFPASLSLMVKKVKDSDTEEELFEAFKVNDRVGNGFTSAAVPRQVCSC